jgi:hypothetical protein
VAVAVSTSVAVPFITGVLVPVADVPVDTGDAGLDLEQFVINMTSRKPATIEKNSKNLLPVFFIVSSVSFFIIQFKNLWKLLYMPKIITKPINLKFFIILLQTPSKINKNFHSVGSMA